MPRIQPNLSERAIKMLDIGVASNEVTRIVGNVSKQKGLRSKHLVKNAISRTHTPALPLKPLVHMKTEWLPRL